MTVLETLVEAATTGHPADFSGARRDFEAGLSPEPSLEAGVLRQLILGLKSWRLPSGFDPGQCSCWTIIGLTMEGRLDLHDGRLPNCSALPALDFAGCVFKGGFSAADAHLERLHFSDCTFGDGPAGDSQIVLRNAQINGELCLTRLRPMVEGGLLRVDASAARVGTNVIVQELVLTAPRNQTIVDPFNTRYALNLRNAEIHSDLILQPQVSIDGGLMLLGAHIGGDLRAGGLTVSDGADKLFREMARDNNGILLDAVNLQSAQIGGNLIAAAGRSGSRVVITGCAHLFGIRVEGGVAIGGIRIDPGSPTEVALQMSSSVIKGGLHCLNVTAQDGSQIVTDMLGQFVLIGGDIGGLLLSGNVHRLDAANLSVRGNTELSILVKERVDLSGANFDGYLDLSHFRFPSMYSLMGASGLRPAFRLIDADVKGALTLGKTFPDTRIHFKEARISSPACYPSLRLIEVAARRTVKETNTEEVVWTAFLARKGWAASVLDGGSSIFHSLNGAGLLHLTSKHEKADYLRLFCAYVWGDDGPFKVIEDTSQIRSLAPGSPPLPPLGPPEFSSARSVTGSESILAHAFIRYSNFLFEAWFEIATSGEIVMKADKPLCELDRNELPKYESSFRSGAHAQKPDYGVRLGASVDEKELKALIPNWELPFRQKTVSFGNAFIDLTDASCGTLEDADGTAWGSDVTLRLENFTFSRIAASSDITDETIGWPWNVVSEVSSSGWATLRAIGQRLRPVFRLVRHWLRLPQRDLPNLQAEVLGRGTPSWFSNLINSGIRRTGTRDRLRWLEQREVIPYPRDRMKKPRVLYENFLPQPYAHLAKVFRDQGDDTTANEIEEQRIRIEHWLEAKQSLKGKLLLPWWGLFGIGFRYGLSPIRAIVTFVMFLLLGWAFVAFANHQGLLVQSSSIAATVVKTSPSGEPAAAVPYTNAQSLSDFPCGNSISQPLYAVDVFIPLLDLRQEARCDIRSIGQSDITGWQAYTSNHRWIGSRIRSALRAWMIYPSVWQWLKALYAVVGWVVTSLTILTLSGTLRKWGQE